MYRQNPYPPPADLIAELRESVTVAATSMNRYPDREALELRQADNKVRKEKEFREWLNSPKMQAGLHTKTKRGLSEETLRRIEEAMKII